MSDKPIFVGGQPLPESVLRGTVRGPIVVTPQEGDSGDTTPRLGVNQPIYKVRMIANGKTFNMLLPPSIESKHPGRSNPMQLPGLQIEAGVAISKLKIPGFFPIYQHLGVESLTISMSGMFTGYDGIDKISTASEWENSIAIGQSSNVEGQDSYTAACELYDFAVKNKVLIEVNIFTSDGSFKPKKSTTTNFRDSQSNIKFKGYIKDFKQAYIRQDRNYYMIKFEIIDLGNNNTCKSIVKAEKKNLSTLASTTSNNNSEVITSDDKRYRDKKIIDQAEKIKALIDKNVDIKEIQKELDGLSTYSLKYKLLLYAESKNYKIDNDLKSLLTIYEIADTKAYPISSEGKVYTRKEYIETAKALCNRFNDLCVNTKKVIEASEKDISNYRNGNNTTSTTSLSAEPSVPVTPIPTISPSNTQLTNDLQKLNDIYNFRQQKGLIKDLKDNNGVISDGNLSNYATLDKGLSKSYTYKGNTTTQFPSDPQPRTYGTFQSSNGDTLLLVPTTNDFSKFKLVAPP